MSHTRVIYCAPFTAPHQALKNLLLCLFPARLDDVALREVQPKKHGPADAVDLTTPADWEEYATPEGYLYYHNVRLIRACTRDWCSISLFTQLYQPTTGVTKWLRSASDRVRPLIQEHANQSTTTNQSPVLSAANQSPVLSAAPARPGTRGLAPRSPTPPRPHAPPSSGDRGVPRSNEPPPRDASASEAPADDLMHARRLGGSGSSPSGPGPQSAAHAAAADAAAGHVVFESLWADEQKGGARDAEHVDGGSVAGRSAAGSHPLRRRHASSNSTLSVDMYEDVFSTLPSMDAATKEALVRAGAVSNQRKMGYADQRPDIRPTGAQRVAPENTFARNQFTKNGASGRADAVWAGSLRPHLYSSRGDPAAEVSGDEIKAAWNGSGLAPSEVTPSYAFRHAMSTSMWAGAGTVYDRLNDHRGYTGSHRHRFDAEGRGLGLQSRENYAYLRSTVETAANRGAPVLPEPLDHGPHPATLSSRIPLSGK